MVPIVATLIGNGLGILANAVMKKGTEFIKEKTGIDLNSSSLSEDDLLKLKQFEMEHEEELLKIALEEKKIGLEETKAYLVDVQDARGREVKLNESEHALWITKATAPVLALGTTLLTILLFAYAMSGKIAPENKDIIIYILGALTAILTQIFSYFFGSSEGSKKKTEELIARVKG